MGGLLYKFSVPSPDLLNKFSNLYLFTDDKMIKILTYSSYGKKI